MATLIVRLKAGVYVLHCFQKEAKRRSETLKADRDLIRNRLREAEKDNANDTE